MIEDEKIDLSPLDPCADRDRTEGRIREVIAYAATVRSRSGISAFLAAWARPALGLAVASAVLALGVLSAPLHAPSTQPSLSDPAEAMLRWTLTGHTPTPAEFLHTFGSHR